MKVKNDKWIIKVLCALGTITLWVLVMTKVNPIVKNNYDHIKVNISNLGILENQEYVLMNDTNDFTVNVKVSGLKNNVLELSSNDIKASIDLKDIVTENKEGIHNLPIKIQNIDNIEITGYSPAYIPCLIEKKITKSIGVRVKYEGVQNKGFYVDKGISNPSSVLIKGPRSIVDSAAYAIAVVNVDGASQILSRTEPVRIVNDQDIEITTLTVNPFTVDITLPIYPTKTVPVVAQIVGVPKDGYKMTDIKAELGSVTIAGSKSILDTISDIKTEPIDITDANVDIIAEKGLVVEEGVIITDSNYKTKVTASIDRIIDKSFDFSFEDIEIINLPEQYDLTPIFDEQLSNGNFDGENEQQDENGEADESGTQDNETDDSQNDKSKPFVFKITLTDVAPKIANINKQDIKLSIDLKDVTEGVNELPIICNKDGEIETIDINPQTVKLLIQLKSIDAEQNSDE